MHGLALPLWSFLVIRMLSALGSEGPGTFSCLQPLCRSTSPGEVSSVSQATHILVPSEAGSFSFLRCMILKIVQTFPNLWAEDMAMFSSWSVGSRK